MMLSIELGKVPDYMDRKMVELMFNEKESIDFNDFSIFFYVQILFNRFSTDKLIKLDSFIQMLQDEVIILLYLVLSCPNIQIN